VEFIGRGVNEVGDYAEDKYVVSRNIERMARLRHTSRSNMRVYAEWFRLNEMTICRDRGHGHDLYR
jgi:hypothetical protein